MPEEEKFEDWMVFVDWLNRICELLEWPDERLAPLEVKIDGKRCGFAAAMRIVASRMHERAVQVHNSINR